MFNRNYITNLRTVFSFPVWLTHMQWLVFDSEYLRNVFVTIAEVSANPNSEWSVKIVPRPIRDPTNRAS